LAAAIIVGIEWLFSTEFLIFRESTFYHDLNLANIAKKKSSSLFPLLPIMATGYYKDSVRDGWFSESVVMWGGQKMSLELALKEDGTPDILLEARSG
jgi:hypothetical protein